MSNEINLNHNGCKVKIAGDNIFCEHPQGLSFVNWQIRLLSDQLVYSSKNEKRIFKVADIKELQYEMGQVSRNSGTTISAIAYVLKNNDDDPKKFFFLGTREEFVYNNKTQAYALCTEILEYIGHRYQIPVAYKLSIATKKKNNQIVWVFLFFILFWLLFFLRLKLDKA